MKLRGLVALIGAVALLAMGAVLATVFAKSVKAPSRPASAVDTGYSPAGSADPGDPHGRPMPRPVEPMAPTPLQLAQRKAGKQGRYLIALFYDPDAPQSRAARQNVYEAVGEHKDRMTVFEAPLTDMAHQTAARQMGIFTTPAAVVLAPSGAVTRHFHEFNDVPSELAKALLSPKTEEILAAVQARKVVFVHVPAPGREMRDHNRQELEGLAQLLSSSISTVLIPPDAEKEQRLITEILKVDTKRQTPVTVVVARNGTVVEKIPGKLTREGLLQAFRRVLVSRSGCGDKGSGPGGGTCQ